MRDIDDLIAEEDERENMARNERNSQQGNSLDYILGEDEDSAATDGRVIIGHVEHFFDKIGVAAIHLVGELKLGDFVEVESGSEMLKFQVSSMQINKKSVDAAHSGDDVGVKVDGHILPGSKVYLANE